jgi:DNA-binding transcriptional LysR family regulator
VELRQLEAFVAVAHELHFGRAAVRLHLGQPTLSDLVRRLERELGTPLFHRTTRRVTLTEAGAVLLARAEAVLRDVADAAEAVRAVASGEEGTVRVGFTPPAAPVLAPHVCAAFARTAPGVRVEQSQLWLPGLQQALRDGTVDVALTCGVRREDPADSADHAADADADDVETHVFASEPLLVGLRPGHRLAAAPTVDLRDLAGERLGTTEPSLFPAWTASQRDALASAGIAPPVVSLRRTDLNAAGWSEQPDVDWVLLIGSLTGGHTGTVVRPVVPPQDVTFVLQWRPSRVRSPAVARFVTSVLAGPLPAGWDTQPGHTRHGHPRQGGAGSSPTSG